mgnify:CR=1 FL=1
MTDMTVRREPLPGIDLHETIGSGGFAVVYRAHQTSVGREVAVKIDTRPLADTQARRRFLREATASARISSHPHVVSLIDVGTTTDGRAYFVMELCPNGSLADLVRSRGALPVADTIELGIAISSALAAAHETGILHRDVKPANVLIDAYGTPRLSDFGISALQSPDGDISATMEALTPGYAPPEVVAGQRPTPAGDVWSLGATLYTLVTGRRPRTNDDGTPRTVYEILSDPYAPLPPVTVEGSEQLARVIERAVAPDPSQRYPNGQALYEALRAIRPAASGPGRLVGGPEAGLLTAARSPQPARATASRRWPLVAAAVLTGILLGSGGTYGVLRLTGAVSAATTATATAAPGAPTGQTAPSGSTAPPEVGVCWGGIVSVAGSVSAQQVPCEQPHSWETYASGFMEEDSEPTTADLGSDENVKKTCTDAALAAYLPGKKGTFETQVVPARQAAPNGTWGFSCVASRESAGQVTGRLKDS